MGNPGGDQQDGTVAIPRCPKCKELFYSEEQLKMHIDWENDQYLNSNKNLRDLTNVLRSKL